MTAQENEDFVETLDDMKDMFIQDIKDAGVPRELWEVASQAAENFRTVDGLAGYRDRIIAAHGYKL